MSIEPETGYQLLFELIDVIVVVELVGEVSGLLLAVVVLEAAGAVVGTLLAVVVVALTTGTAVIVSSKM